MKNLFKSIIFVLIFVIIYMFFSYLFLPKANLSKYGIYNTSMYEILGEKSNTIDVAVIGDSLVYSSISPMDIYGEYGFTVFDCSEAAQILPDAYDYFKIVVESQKPKVVLVEANIFFRDVNKRPWYNKPLKIMKNSLPLVTYHNNWKNMLFPDKKINGWTNVSKGYKKITDVKSSKKLNYVEKTNIKKEIPVANYDLIEKFIESAKNNNIKLIFIGFPSQKSWSYSKHMRMQYLAAQYNITYINFNYSDIVNINWKKDTKDYGDHLNDYGAKKISKYIGKYLDKLNLLTDHRNDKEYDEWNKAYNYYINN